MEKDKENKGKPASGRARGAVLRIGERLRDIRKLANVTQSELASRLHIEQSALSRLEKRDDVHVSTLRDYVEALGATLKIDVQFNNSSMLMKYVEDARFFNFEVVDENQLLLPIIEDDSFPNRRDVVFSIKPQYSEKIINGVKTVELRRRFPVNVPPGTIALIYSTSPTRAVTGIAEIEGVLKGKPDQIWRTYSKQACIEKSDFDNYFAGVENGFVIKLSNPRRLRRQVELSELRQRFNFEPPQSFLYAPPQLRKALLNESA